MDVNANQSGRSWLLAVCAVCGLAAVSYLGYKYSPRYRDESKSAIQTQMDALETMIDAYEVDFGTYPAGDTRAIFKTLAGDNPKGIQYMLPKGLTPEGDFRDPWGTPYIITLAGKGLLIHSAGPNKKFEEPSSWFSDDLYNRDALR